MFKLRNYLSIKNKNRILSEILYMWINTINYKLSKKITGIIFLLDFKKIILLMISEINFLKIVQKILWKPDLNNI